MVKSNDSGTTHLYRVFIVHKLNVCVKRLGGMGVFVLTVLVTKPCRFYISLALVTMCFSSIVFKITTNFPTHFTSSERSLSRFVRLESLPNKESVNGTDLEHNFL